jgi:ATP-dependent Clp protease ATP-binding subunit ClpA
MLQEGTDPQYGARHLKRAIERHLTFPLSSLIATEQVGMADRLVVDMDPAGHVLVFSKEVTDEEHSPDSFMSNRWRVSPTLTRAQ